MDVAVGLVRTYLHLNGYFTVTEYPIVEAMAHGGYRTSTDVDVLAVRFPGAGRVVASRHAERRLRFEADPALDGPPEKVDMIIGEVKEGRAELNRGARDPLVLETVLARFGCCSAEIAERAAQDLIRRGRADLSPTHHARLVAFGSVLEKNLGYPCQAMALGHLVRFIQGYVREHWDVLRHAQFKDPSLGLLMTLEKALGSLPAEDSPDEGKATT